MIEYAFILLNKKFYFIPVKQVFSDMDFLGWYTSGDVPDDRDIKIHKQICEINESPVLLKLNPMARHSDVCFYFSSVKKLFILCLCLIQLLLLCITVTSDHV